LGVCLCLLWYFHRLSFHCLHKHQSEETNDVPSILSSPDLLLSLLSWQRTKNIDSYRERKRSSSSLSPFAYLLEDFWKDSWPSHRWKGCEDLDSP
jgi:hypothetical protein